MAPAAEENSTHLHRCQEGLVPAYTHFILRSGLDEEITEDFFFSPNLLPLSHCVSSRPLWDGWMLSGHGLKEMLLFSYWSLLAGRLLSAGSEPGGREGTGSLRTKIRRVHPGAPCRLPAY